MQLQRLTDLMHYPDDGITMDQLFLDKNGYQSKWCPSEKEAV